MVTTASIIVSCLSQTSHHMGTERRHPGRQLGLHIRKGRPDRRHDWPQARISLFLFFFFTNQKGKGSYLCGVIVVNFEKLAHYTLVLLVAF